MTDAMPVSERLPGPPVTVNIVNGKIDPALMDDETREMWVSRLKDALGTESEDLANYALITMFRTLKHPEALKINAMIETVRAGCPRDPQEMMLLVQMAACSQRMQEAIIEEAAALTPGDQLSRAKIVHQYGQLYTRHLEALRRYRRTGDEKITVVHVGDADAVGIKAG